MEKNFLINMINPSYVYINGNPYFYNKERYGFSKKKLEKYDNELQFNLKYIDNFYNHFLKVSTKKHSKEKQDMIKKYLKIVKTERKKVVSIYKILNWYYDLRVLELSDLRKKLIIRIENHFIKINKFIKSLYSLDHIIKKEWNGYVGILLDKKGVGCTDLIKSFL